MSQTNFIGKMRLYWDKLWYILWKDNSVKGWIISILFIFLFMKFIFFPTISFVTGTALPLAIVESCSMYHEGNLFSNFNNWWDAYESKYTGYDISKSDFENFIFKKGFNKGDILFILGAKPEKIKIGDVIIFSAQTNHPVIHRVINIQKQGDEYSFSTIGDNNDGQLSFETNIKESQIVGKAVFKIAPYLGWGKLIFFDWKNPASQRGFC